MNKPLAIAGATAGALCAFLLTVGMPSSLSSMFPFSCTWSSSASTASRDLQWSGGDSVEIRVPASVHFTVGPVWRATAEGSAGAIKHLRFRNGRIEFDRFFLNNCDTNLVIELTGPSVRQWNVVSSGELVLEQLNQSDLDIVLSGSGSITANGEFTRTHAELNGSGQLRFDGGAQKDIAVYINGSGTVTASGAAERMSVAIPGSGRAKLAALAVKEAAVSIAGSGAVDLSVEDSVDVQIDGSGAVKLLKKPKVVRSQIRGSGMVMGG